MKNIIYAFKRMLNKKTGKINQKWTFDTGSQLNSGPVVSDIDGDNQLEIITGTKDGKLIALDQTGKVKWIYSINENVDDLELMFLDANNINSIDNTPLAADLDGSGKNNVIFGTELGYVYVLTFEGELVWKFKTNGAVKGKVVASRLNEGKIIIFGSTDNYVYCLDSKGSLLWKFNTGSGVEGDPAIIDDNIIIGNNAGEIFSLTKQGELNWKFKTNSKVVAQAVGFKNKLGKTNILIGSTDDKLYCLNNQGIKEWEFRTEGAIYSKVAVNDVNDDGIPEIIFGSCDNKVYCLNLEGKKLWSFETDFWVVSTPLIVDIDNDNKKEIIVGSYDHNIYVLDSNGEYLMDYAPGVGGTINQAGNYSDVMTQQPGKIIGKKLWQFNVEGMIVGCTVLGPDVVLNTKKGHIKTITHEI